MTGKRRVVLTVVLAVLVSVAASPAAVAVATPPPPPAAYYGSLTVNGDPARPGVTITARIDGEVRGSLTTEQTGSYGGSGAFEPKLQVDGIDAEEGATVRFFVNGVETDETVTWSPGAVERMDLTVSGNVYASGDGGSGGGGQQSSESDNDRAASVRVERSGNETRVSVTDAEAGREVNVTLSTDGDDGENVSLDGLALTPTNDTNITLDVSYHDVLPNESADGPATDGPSGEPPGGAVGYVSLDHDVPDEEIGEVRFRFRTSKDRLAERGISADEVTLYRYHDGEWTHLETSVAGETATHYRFEATSPGLSVFAIGVDREPDVAVVDAILSTDEISPGSVVTVTATVENRGRGDGIATLSLLVDGSPVADRSVSVPAGESRTVEFTRQFDDTGSYEIAVSDVSAGRLVVIDQQVETTSAAGDESEAVDDADRSASSVSPLPSLPSLVIVGIVFGAVVATSLYWLRGRNGPPEKL